MPDELIAQYKDDTRETFLMAHLGLACIIYGLLVSHFRFVGCFLARGGAFIGGFITLAPFFDHYETPPPVLPIQAALSAVVITLTTVFGAGYLAFTSAPASYIAHHGEKRSMLLIVAGTGTRQHVSN